MPESCETVDEEWEDELQPSSSSVLPRPDNNNSLLWWPPPPSNSDWVDPLPEDSSDWSGNL